MIDLKKVREIVNEHVRIAIGEIEEKEPRIIFAVRDKLLGTKEAWRVTIRYTPKTQIEGLKQERTAIFKIDAETGEVLQFEEGWGWSF
jgi:hypothetical protein